ncbi:MULTISPECIES: P-II family nitrogen regulator [Bacillales]|uniref:P-II family nitrogen regulator n=1 Tax=Bacillales TaxID=1385 RepID=UPI00188346A8|nr:P-II family nitrogen regulator [Pseudalkalibacillus hwajinpoensis]MBF0708140.1 P-II family nitrogen regulator [Pseudalkalibacillus hwajinpoensis]WLR59465.1 P-II family nitrogen regulator [Pseudalkalibacillus hwajinpoensis]
MKKVEAIIRPEAFQDLRDRLRDEGITGMTVSEVAGCGLQKKQTGVFRGSHFEVSLQAKIKVELVFDDDLLDHVVKHIRDICATGEVGDGKIFVYPVEDVIRIRSGEHGLTAFK